MTINTDKLFSYRFNPSLVATMDEATFHGVIARLNHLEALLKVSTSTRQQAMLSATPEWQNEKAKQQAITFRNALDAHSRQALRGFTESKRFVLNEKAFKEQAKRIYSNAFAELLEAHPIPCPLSQSVFNERYGEDGMKGFTFNVVWDDPKEPANQEALLQVIDKKRTELASIGAVTTLNEAQQRGMDKRKAELMEDLETLTIALAENIKATRKLGKKEVF